MSIARLPLQNPKWKTSSGCEHSKFSYVFLREHLMRSDWASDKLNKIRLQQREQDFFDHWRGRTIVVLAAN
jgi:hypothetical protein